MTNKRGRAVPVSMRAYQDYAAIAEEQLRAGLNAQISILEQADQALLELTRGHGQELLGEIKKIEAARTELAQDRTNALIDLEKAEYSAKVMLAKQYLSSGIVAVITASDAERTERARFFSEERNQIAANEAAVMIAYEDSKTWAVQSALNIRGAAYKGMEMQMLSLVETGRFSAAAFGEIIVQQVKMELVGIAAKAAVWALYELAAGIAASSGPWGLATFGNPAAHFAAAATFASISGASLVAAMGVQAVFGGTVAGAGASGSAVFTGGGARPSFNATPAGFPITSAIDAKSGQNVTLVVKALDPSSVNWDKLMADNIAPALEKLSGDGNKPLNIQVATA